MDAATARRVVVGSIALAGTVSAVRALADNDPRTKARASILLGALGSAGALAALAGPAPDLAGGLAVIVLVTSLMPQGQTAIDRVASLARRSTSGDPALGGLFGALDRDYSTALSAAPPARRLTGNPSPDYQPGTGALQAGAGIVTVRGVKGEASFLADLWRMVDAAAADGVTLTPGQVYRTRAEQVAARIRNGCPDVYTSPASTCRVPTAIPGTSMHETGQAVDFRNLSTAGYRWLVEHAASYSIQNLPSERWHWSRNGR